MATNTLIVKMTQGTDIRRFTSSSTTLNWKELAKRARECFDVKKFKMTYVDDEGDKVTVSSDEELSEAVALALSCTPPILRLAVHPLTSVEADKAANAEDKATGTTPASGANKDFTVFMETVAKQLPAIYDQLPESVRNIIPHAEIDVAATVAANLGGDGFVQPPKADAKEGVHEGVTCDKSGMCPIVGNRYHLVGHNYDLCETEFNKLDDKEKAVFKKIAPPGAEAAKEAAVVGFHPGVSCDRSGMVPIVGTRFKLRGHNYDLCQTEFDKLPEGEKSLYDAIPPLFPVTNGQGDSWRGHHRGGWGRGWGGHHMHPAAAFGKGMGGKGMGSGKGCGKGGGGSLAARFICDVAVFDGTQVAPGTNFTKIWRIKNSGEMPWPPGTRILFVGGDQMTTEMSVPIGRFAPVMPGEEVDVAVAMTAPNELGRYLGYWRLAGPHLRRKWGQRVWAHVQVVDPSQPAGAVDIESAVAEFEKLKSKLPADDMQADGGEDDGDSVEELAEATAMKAASASMAVATSMTSTSTSMASASMASMPIEAAPPPASDKHEEAVPELTIESVADKVAEAVTDGNLSDDGVLVTDTMVVEAQLEAPPPAAEEALSGVARVKAALKAMGFIDDTMLDAVVSKHGEDLDACATDLTAASEWDSLLEDLAEMGFENRELNKMLMLKNNGNIKRTVKDLVEA